MTEQVPKTAAEVEAQLDRIEVSLQRLIATLREQSEERRAAMKWFFYE